MEVRDFKGCFVIDGRETETCNLRVILSTGGNGVTSGSGAVALPLALVGVEPGTRLTFRTDGGDEIGLEMREVDAVDGWGYFLTVGELPRLAQEARRA